MAKALWELRQMVERLLGEAYKGTPTGGYELGFFAASAFAMYPDDYFNDWQGRFYSGTHKDTSFVVKDFTQASTLFEFQPALAVKPDATDLFELIPPDFSVLEIADAINLSLVMVEGEALQDKVNDGTEVVASVFEYPIPGGFIYLDEIYQEDGTAGRYSPSAGRIDYRHWMIRHGAQPKLWFDNSYVSLTAGRHLRLVGQQAPAQLEADADLCDVSPAFLVYQAKALLHQSRVRGGGAAFENHEVQMQMAQAMAARERALLRVAGRGRKVNY